jgi:hypothetical protein
MKRISQEPIEIYAIPKTSLLQKKIQTRLLIIAGFGILLLFVPSGQSHATGENNLIIYIMLTPPNLLLIDLFFIFTDYRKAKRLDNFGTQAFVVLRKKYKAKAQGFNARHLLKWNFYFLEYQLSKGLFIKSAVSRDIYESLSEGNCLSISYLEDLPTIQRVERRITG